MDWSTTNGLLAVGLGPQVYTWRSTGEVIKVVDVDTDDLTSAPGVSSVRWVEKVSSLPASLLLFSLLLYLKPPPSQSDHIAIGKTNGEVAIYDCRTSQQLRQLTPHSSRVGVLATLPQTLTSGSADRTIVHRDLRARNEVVRVIKGHKGEVTALKWNSDRELASGSNDNSVRVFKGFDEVSDVAFKQPYLYRRRNRCIRTQTPILKLRKAHTAAIKALAWNPHQSGILATGGGTDDQFIRIWNTRTGKLTREIDTGSQVSLLSRTLPEPKR